MKNRKKPVYAPFNAVNDELAYMDTDSVCASVSIDEETVTKMTLDELLSLEKELAEAVCDWETIIDIELSESKTSNESLSDDRRKLQRTKCELREVKQRIRMMRAETGEELAAA